MDEDSTKIMGISDPSTVNITLHTACRATDQRPRASPELVRDSVAGLGVGVAVEGVGGGAGGGAGLGGRVLALAPAADTEQLDSLTNKAAPGIAPVIFILCGTTI